LNSLKLPEAEIDAITDLIKQRVIRLVIMKLGVVATGPWGIAISFVVGVLWDKIIAPEIDNILLEGQICLIKQQVLDELKIKLDAKTQEELINALRHS
jgi:hypothetical protein